MDTNELGINIKWSKELRKNIEQVKRCFHIIDPRITIDSVRTDYKTHGYKLSSEYEDAFIFNTFTQSFGQDGGGIIQLLAAQRPLSSILRNNLPANLPQHVRRDFESQR